MCHLSLILGKVRSQTKYLKQFLKEMETVSFFWEVLFFWIIYLSETYVNKNNVTFIISWNAARIAFNPEVTLRLPVLQTLVPYFKRRRTFIQTSTDRRRARCWREKKRNRGEIPGDASPQRPNVWQKQRSALLSFKPKNNYQCMKLPRGCGCDVSAEEQVVCQPASQEHHDWWTRGARLTPLVWLTHGAPVPCHLADL